jgi:glycerophosphoryl diester phosphodiesterase
MSRPLLLGHRGARSIKSIPENTIASFDRALADGCDGFEFDVRLTADQQAVICHDPRVGGLDIAVSFAAQLSTRPRLQDVFDRYPAAFLDIELKVAGLERILMQALHAQRPQRFLVSSFLPEVLETLKALDAAIPLGLICETRTELERWNDLPVEYLIPHRRLVQRDLVQEFQEAGKKVLPWTVNAAAEMRQFAGWGIDGLISDNTKLLCATVTSG